MIKIWGGIMDLAVVAENIGDGRIITDIYSGNFECKCGKKIRFEELNLGGFGTSLSCSCGTRFWFAEEEDSLKDLLVYEGYNYVINDHFLIVKQRIYSEISWNKKRLINKKLREQNEYLYIDFENKLFAYFDDKGRRIKDGGQLFFKNVSIKDMINISEGIDMYCRRNNIVPNYGEILGRLTSSYNTVDYEKMLKKVLHEYYIESLVKEGLSYLFNYNFLINVDTLEKRIIIDKNSTTSNKILGVPKKIVSYIRDHKMDSSKIAYLQNFFIENNYNDFKALLLDKNSIFKFEDLDRLNTLMNYGYSAYKLNRYAKEIMNEEGLNKHNFLTYLIDSVRMSRASDLKFKLYGKRLKERHDELVCQYKLIKNEAIPKNLLKIHNNTVIKQYGEEYIAIVPSSIEDFKEEGQNQRHCVLSYTEAAANGETLILFIRYKEDLKKSYITLEIRNKKIIQAKKFANQSINQEDKKYLECLSKINGWYF